MAKSRPDKTLADYLAIGVTPVLIMLLVGSLVFFLQTMIYSGQYNSRVNWILFWFVVGQVLIARIAIESGRAQASLYTLGLGGAVALAIFRFVPDKQLLVIGCLAVIWWCTDKLTWDCTLIDETEDASGEGLLQVAGVADAPELSGDQPPGSTTEPPPKQPRRVPFWMRLFLNTSERSGKAHAPGLWVVYFSIAALPIFGFGQTLIPAQQAAERGFAFRCLFVYVAAALGLLLMTSFLGLRRYLRQRNLQMPSAMAASWVGMGVAVILGILFVCLVLPRPQGEYTLTAMIDQVGDKVQEASDRSVLKNDGVQKPQQPGDGKPPEQPAAAQQPGNQQPQGQQQGQQGQAGQQQPPGQPGQQPNGQQPGQQQNAQQPGEQKSPQQQAAQNQQAQNQHAQQPPNSKPQPGQQPSQQGNPQQGQQPQQAQQQQGQQQKPGEQKPPEPAQQQPDQKPADNQPTPQPEPQRPSLSGLKEILGSLFKWVMYGVLAVVALYFAIRHWAAVANFLARLWAEFLSLFGRRPTDVAETSAEPIEAAAPARPFADFSNPFHSGRAKKAAPKELVRYTFEALSAWATEHHCGRSADQTPMEFGQQLLGTKLDFATEANEVTQLYARVAYAGLTPNADSMALLERLWRRLQ